MIPDVLEQLWKPSPEQQTDTDYAMKQPAVQVTLFLAAITGVAYMVYQASGSAIIGVLGGIIALVAIIARTITVYRRGMTR